MARCNSALFRTWGGMSSSARLAPRSEGEERDDDDVTPPPRRRITLRGTTGRGGGGGTEEEEEAGGGWGSGSSEAMAAAAAVRATPSLGEFIIRRRIHETHTMMLLFEHKRVSCGWLIFMRWGDRQTIINY